MGSLVIVAGIVIGLVGALVLMALALAAVAALAGSGGADDGTAQTRLGTTRFVDGRPGSANSLLSVEVTGIILGE